MEHNILGDGILAWDRGKNGAALLRVKSKVMDDVATDFVVARLVPFAAVDPVGATSHADPILPDVSHLVCWDQGVAVEIRQENSIASDWVKERVIDRACEQWSKLKPHLSHLFMQEHVSSQFIVPFMCTTPPWYNE
jgi:hypothetical protein